MQETTVKMEVDDSIKEVDGGDNTELSYEEKLKYVNAISQPMASKKLTKKIYKCIRKGMYDQSNCKYFFLMPLEF